MGNGMWSKIQRLVRSPVLWVVLGTGLAAIAIAITAVFTGVTDFWTVVSLGATLWALFLAIMIYIVTAGDKREILDRVRDAYATILAEHQQAADLAYNKAHYAEWIRALADDGINVPLNEIISVRPVGRRNPQVLIGTKRGSNYRVYKGGRNGGFTITHLPKTEPGP